jgi:5,5'-dehydrodivanillate O-demethylase
MGEDFTLYRGESGSAHLVASRCPHRLTQLSTGWVEGDSLRCRYHGWRFDECGQCDEQPAEPHPFCRKIRIAAYPTREQLGLVFAYLGPEPTPPLSEWPELMQTELISTSSERLPCNYFQSAENIMDDVHVRFAHHGAPGLSMSKRAGIPGVSAEETSYGLVQHLQLDGVNEHNHFIMPNICYLVVDDYEGQTEPVQHLFFYVPIDDVSHNHVRVDAVGYKSGGKAREWNASRAAKNTGSVEDEIHAVLAGEKNVDDLKQHPELVRIQDGVTIVGQGKLCQREGEHLGTSDAAVILLRKIWQRELRALAAGGELTPFARPADFGEMPPRRR